jgi:hypothetical protein
LMTWIPSFLPAKVATPKAPRQRGRGGNADDDGVGGTGRKTNPDKHQRLTAFGRRVGRKIQGFLTKVGATDQPAVPPKMTNGKDHCLTWQIKGNCMENGCARCASHVKLSQLEEDALVNFLEAGCVAIGA